MLQSFEAAGSSALSAKRVAALRAEMVRCGIDGFVVPRSDEFQGEYVADYAERLRWLSGYSGSAGLAIVLADKAAIFVDGRYTIQVREQVDTDIFEPRHLIDEPPADWIVSNLKQGQVLGYDPWLMTAAQTDRFAKACEKAGAEFKAVEHNLIDVVWQDQPQRPAEPVVMQPTQFAGRTAQDKQTELRAALEAGGADAVVLTLPDSVAWAFNIRGSDIAHTPVALAFAIVHGGDQPAELFIHPDRVPEDVTASLDGVANLQPREAFESALAALGERGARVLVDAAWAPQAVRQVLTDSGAEIVAGSDPCIMPKACKNAAELEGARAAQRRDGVAMVRFLAWLDRQAPAGGLDEISAAQQLEAFRAETDELKDLSFDSISGAGPHAAIPHYRVSTASNWEIEPDSIYLIDSGGQYRDGTTDITRTVIVGEATAEMKDRFTRVLKGMINLSRVRFPAGTTGGNLDVLARLALWQAGLDFDHGTGHGVGSYLSVHEGPARFSKIDKTKLKPGMILSNEPGYYKAGAFGIRIENLVVVREAEPVEGGERDMHWLETLTLCPIDRRLIEVALLDTAETDWLDQYHARVRSELSVELDGADLAWLEAASAPLAR
jgi:Xaa-Pro aminopeptidase